MFAAKRHDKKTMFALLEHGADLSIRSNEKNTVEAIASKIALTYLNEYKDAVVKQHQEAIQRSKAQSMWECLVGGRDKYSDL